MNTSNAPVRRYKINEKKSALTPRHPVSLPIYFQIEVCHDIHIQLDKLSKTENATEIVALTVNNLLTNIESETI